MGKFNFLKSSFSKGSSSTTPEPVYLTPGNNGPNDQLSAGTSRQSSSTHIHEFQSTITPPRNNNIDPTPINPPLIDGFLDSTYDPSALPPPLESNSASHLQLPVQSTSTNPSSAPAPVTLTWEAPADFAPAVISETASSNFDPSTLEEPDESPPSYEAARVPAQPVTYTFSNLGKSSSCGLLLPPAESPDTRPLYYIAVSNNFMWPTCLVTSLFKGSNADGDYVGGFTTILSVYPHERHTKTLSALQTVTIKSKEVLFDRIFELIKKKNDRYVYRWRGRQTSKALIWCSRAMDPDVTIATFLKLSSSKGSPPSSENIPPPAIPLDSTPQTNNPSEHSGLIARSSSNEPSPTHTHEFRSTVIPPSEIEDTPTAHNPVAISTLDEDHEVDPFAIPPTILESNPMPYLQPPAQLTSASLPLTSAPITLTWEPHTEFAPAAVISETASSSNFDRSMFNEPDGVPPSYEIARVPAQPVTYTFSNLGKTSNSGLLLPPVDSPDTRPLYYIAVSNKFMWPNCLVTSLFKGSSADGDYVGGFTTILSVYTGPPLAGREILTDLQTVTLKSKEMPTNQIFGVIKNKNARVLCFSMALEAERQSPDMGMSELALSGEFDH
ncbi:hypothetical protein CVT24_000674 [Panaeolus cyanescens]|uniref:Uncharacterized protein n=1 Tax=Panaeolus cyanescens TaxID=181874 RepID=A0A409VWM4_9AGAR|nr:hypothetical protein CVT24_000674 [Panaeolus cyanescens]